MKFRDLDPVFVAEKNETPTVDGAVGIRYRCPCGGHRMFIPFENPRGVAPLAAYGCRWDLVSGATADDLTLSPSIRTVSGPDQKECAHYFIRNGEIVNA